MQKTKTNTMKSSAMIMGFLVLLAVAAGAQVNLNDKGQYINKDGSLYTGKLEQSEPDMSRSALEIKDGLANGQANYYYASGKLMETGSFEKGLKNGTWMRYNETGINTALAVYAAGKKDGAWMVWDDSGNKLFEMHYANGEKTGIWYKWDSRGDLVSAKDFGSGN